jgi:hypothetical protein
MKQASLQLVDNYKYNTYYKFNKKIRLYLYFTALGQYAENKDQTSN